MVWAALLGVHEELIQGLLPDRTYGVADIAANAVGAGAGSLMAHGMALFEERADRGPDTLDIPRFEAAALALGVALLAAGLPAFRDGLVPGWLLTPVLAAGALFAARTGGWRGGPGDPVSWLGWLCISTAL